MGLDADSSTLPEGARPTRTFPPPKGPSPATVLVLVLGVVAVTGFGYGLWVAANSGRGWEPLPSISVLFSRSPDGLTWVITFTGVPSIYTPTNTCLSLATASAATLIPPTQLASLTGGEVPVTTSTGTLYLFYHGQSPGQLLAGDQVLIGTTIAGSGASTEGCTADLTANGLVLWQDTLQ